MTAKLKTIAIVNGTGRQAASLIRVASALGYQVRAQVHSRQGLVAEELAELPGVTLFEGPLTGNNDLINVLFVGAHYAFINTTYLAGDEVAIGKALADAAKRSGSIQHYIYSSMPDHSIHNPNWPALPLWSCKFAVENYIRQLGLPATFVYTGIYNNNFTSLPFPLFCMELRPDGSFEWRSPFHPDIELPWLDAEHDVGPAVIQIFKDGPKRWKHHRIALAFELLTPRQVCRLFSRALERPVRYIHSPKIDIRVPIPSGYREQLEGIEYLFGQLRAPYFPGPEYTYPSPHSQKRALSSSSHRPYQQPRGPSFDLPIRTTADLKPKIHRKSSTSTITPSNSLLDDIPRSEVRAIATKSPHLPPSASPIIAPSTKSNLMIPPSPTLSATAEGNAPTSLVDEARNLWEGWRSMEEYAREVFPIEEENNGLDWMREGEEGMECGYSL
ncbi:putative nitrogen metabolic regulation protein [Phaeomoniella chlamydospora]|uniref:Putative nitrogen metabolic regulation protein n=1 Tax=Phaeomoniella chlamydospora TaxID=158046 RepID=A0A0G2GJK8_PHACM|nr:putative nitrogen metabolic regulation protein [Phaeomoniella chlamydospora]